VPLGVLITQCLQQDFVAPLLPGDPVPCLLHIGHREALRLCGSDSERGTLATFMRWAHAEPADRLRVIHIRDWHDPDDPKQAGHLARFGAHCIRSTIGARFVAGINELARDNPAVRIVDASGLNDFEGTTLHDAIEEARHVSPDGQLRVGVVGVWTDAKLSFLLYDLATREGVAALGTCSAFTASVSAQQHLNALDQLSRLLDVRVDHSHGEFASWLTGNSSGLTDTPRFATPGALVEVAFAGETPAPLVNPRGDDRALLAYLFRDCRRVEVKALGGGFSGATVLLADSVDSYGHRQATSVVKIGDRRGIGAERVAFERIEGVLGNSAPALIAFADIGQRGGLRYRYASIGVGAVRSFQDIFVGGQGDDEAHRVLGTALSEILGKLYAAATPEPIDLLAAYEFAPKWAPDVARHVEALAGTSAPNHLPLGAFGEVPNVVRFYDSELAVLPSPKGYRHPASFVHGDLNGQNILVDARGNVWIIDFGRVRYGHALADFAKLENDILYIMTPLTETESAEARLISEALVEHDIGTELGVTPEGVRSPSLLRAWRAIANLRAIAAPISAGADPVGYRTALLRFAAHTLSFTEPSVLQRRWALATAGLLSARVAADIRRLDRLRVDWVDVPAPGRIGITLCPGRGDRRRDLTADMAALKGAETTDLLTLITDSEMELLGVSSLPERARALGFEHRWVPIPDNAVPDPLVARQLARSVAQLARDGRSVVVHCRGGLGRSGTVVALALIELGVPTDEAIVSVRRARGPMAIDPGLQEIFVRTYRA
jgi:protein-tyrosine phosphatase/nicotinamidase-related amidase